MKLPINCNTQEELKRDRSIRKTDIISDIEKYIKLKHENKLLNKIYIIGQIPESPVSTEAYWR